MVWGNFGYLLVSTAAHQTFVELNAFLRPNQEHGTAICQFDVRAFHNHDRNMFEVLLNIGYSR